MRVPDRRVGRRRTLTPAGRVAANASRARYGKTAKGKATARRYRMTEKHRAGRRIYDRARRLRIKETLIGRPRPPTCEVCSHPPMARDLHLDHDHKTGKPRGWLCHHCNIAIGNAEDSPWRLRALADYVERGGR